jgi:ubiquitin C-terminal hydrolase
VIFFVALLEYRNFLTDFIVDFFSFFFQEKVQARDPPSTYLNKLKTYLDPKASKSSRKIQSLGDTNSTQVLRNLEISLRTNNIEWVREFLSEESQGLNILIEYLNSRLQLMRCKLAAEKEKNVDNGGFGRFLFMNKCFVC